MTVWCSLYTYFDELCGQIKGLCDILGPTSLVSRKRVNFSVSFVSVNLSIQLKMVLVFLFMKGLVRRYE